MNEQQVNEFARITDLENAFSQMLEADLPKGWLIPARVNSEKPIAQMLHLLSAVMHSKEFLPKSEDGNKYLKSIEGSIYSSQKGNSYIFLHYMATYILQNLNQLPFFEVAEDVLKKIADGQID